MNAIVLRPELQKRLERDAELQARTIDELVNEAVEHYLRGRHQSGSELATTLPVDIWANYDAERVRQTLRASRGALTGVDREKLLRDVHAQRGQNSDGRPAE
jgi:hypothetical protein